ncbi:DUF6591 domain-containing protein [uncultured Eubacterium sp.]|uniref:DUF6591 domain-containing protein n=1 Tax=uncultured Eubacterium sp. TaxID=165185 RepID=UPI0015C11293|nr:DUF6591 domain-containing protein [uncultured Eubacterium sp.]
MKRTKILSVILAVITIATLFGCANANKSDSVEESTTKPLKNGFDTSTNVNYEFEDFEFSVPNYFGNEKSEDDKVWIYSETGESSMFVQFQQMNFGLTESDLKEESIDEWSKSYFDGMAKSVVNVIYKNSFDLSNDSFVIRKQSFSGTVNEKDVDIDAYIIASKETCKTVCVSALQTENTQYNYLSDAEKMVLSVSEKIEQVSLDFKAMMDSYEEFFDEYIEFMKKYSESQDVMSMISDYSNYMTKYSEVMQKMNSVDTSELSPADYAYYVEVTERITEKLANSVPE